MFDASGKYVEEHTSQIWFSPDRIRHMAGWVIDQCVDGEKMGGFMTYGISATTDYLSAPSTNIFAPLREYISVSFLCFVSVNFMLSWFLCSKSRRNHLLHGHGFRRYGRFPGQIRARLL